MTLNELSAYMKEQEQLRLGKEKEEGKYDFNDSATFDRFCVRSENNNNISLGLFFSCYNRGAAKDN